MKNEEETLDPSDWTEARELAHRMVDDAVCHLEQVRERHVWQPLPEDVRAHFRTPLPTDPQPLGEVYEGTRSWFNVSHLARKSLNSRAPRRIVLILPPGYAGRRVSRLGGLAMAQMGFFDLSDRYASLDAKRDPLVEVDAVVPWEEFRPTLERVWRKPEAERKSRAGRKLMDAVLMFKALVLSALYNLSDDQIEY